MAIKLDTIDALREKMKDAPEVAKEKRIISKQDAIRELKKDIESMQKRGYTLEDIAKFLSDGGLQITTPTLKSYLQRSKEKKAPKKQEKATNPVTEKVSENKATTEKSKGSFSVRPDSDI